VDGLQIVGGGGQETDQSRSPGWGNQRRTGMGSRVTQPHVTRCCRAKIQIGDITAHPSSIEKNVKCQGKLQEPPEKNRTLKRTLVWGRSAWGGVSSGVSGPAPSKEGQRTRTKPIHVKRSLRGESPPNPPPQRGGLLHERRRIDVICLWMTAGEVGEH